MYLCVLLLIYLNHQVETNLNLTLQEDFMNIRWDENNMEHWTATAKLEELGLPLKVPDEFDWTQHGILTPVKDQGNFGSCWTFGTTATLESAWVLAGNPNTRMSTQQLVDCVQPATIQVGSSTKYCLGGDCLYSFPDRPWA